MEIVKIDDVQLDIPNIEDIGKWNYGLEKSTRYIWLDEYVCDIKNCHCELISHKLSKSSRGTVFLDEKKIKDQKEGLRIFDIFGKLYQKQQ